MSRYCLGRDFVFSWLISIIKLIVNLRLLVVTVNANVLFHISCVQLVVHIPLLL